MANLLDRFKKSSVGSYNQPINYIDEVEEVGDFKKYTGLDAIVKSWKVILTTPIRTYDHDPEFGSKLTQYIFAQCDNRTSEEIRDEVEESLTRFDSRASIEQVDVTYLNNRKGFVVDIIANYQGSRFTLKQPIDETLVG